VPRVVLFWLIFGLLNWTVSRVYVRKEIAGSRAGRTEREFGRCREQVDTLAVGDSHMASGFDPRFFSGSFNFALHGETYVYNYYKLKRVLKNNPQIRVVLLPLDFHSFSSWRADRALRDYYWVRYVNYPELGWLSREPLPYIGKYIRGRFFPYLGESSALLGSSVPDEEGRRGQRPETVQGYVIKTGNYNKNREEQAVRRVRLHFAQNRVFDDLLARYFRKILELCAARGAELVLVKFPVSEPYYRLASRRAAKADVYRRAEEIIRPYRNVRILDFQTSFFDRDRELFDDPDHLNEAGAKILTLEIKGLLSDKAAGDMRLPTGKD
jgi:hypothetical protein